MNNIMAPKIPDRWIPYKACGDVIEGTRIICFKVPLNKNVQNDPEIKKIWDIPAIIADIPKLGAVIDLTNTARYYNPRDFEEAGVTHRKILMPGRELPSEEKVKEFMDAVDEFLGISCDLLVGVHCTHGLNRTGYMVCRYMRDRLNIPAEDAIKRFEKARGYEIEREIYLASLLDKELPRPDFEADSISRSSDHNESRQRIDAQTRNLQGKRRGNRYEQSRNINDGQVRNINDGQVRNINDGQKRNRNDSQARNSDDQSDNKKLTKNQRKRLKRKRNNQDESRVKSQETQPKTKKRKIYNYH